MIGAFIIGLFGSLHCVGMCGPIVMTFMSPGRPKASFILYHAGRILTYVFLGGFLGLIGASVTLFQMQQLLVLFLGVVLIALYGIPSLRHQLERFYYESVLYRFLKSFLVKNLSVRKKWFLSGLANGFFPCGLTYVAAAGAVALGSPLESALFMVFFGLGTIPGLVALVFAGNTLFPRIKKIIPRSITVLAILSGSIMVLRGLLSAFPHFNEMVQANATTLMTVCGME